MRSHLPLRRFPGSLVAIFVLTVNSILIPAHAAPPLQRITHGIPSLVERSRSLGAIPADERIPLSLVLPLRNEAGLDDLLSHLYTPGDPAYGQYLTQQQFTAQFGPTQADYNAVVAWAKAQGLTITETYVSRKIVRVAAPARVVEQTFGTQLRRYRAPDGSIFRAPTSDARVPVDIATRLAAVLGLDTISRVHPHLKRRLANPIFPEIFPQDDGFTPLGGGIGGPGGGIHIHPNGPGSLIGPDGGLSPLGIEVAYDLADPTTGDLLIGQTGKGQTLGLFELDGYTLSDITTYEKQFGITPVTLQNVLIDGFNGIPTTGANSGANEVTLDIEMMTALAPGVNKIIVYEGNPTNAYSTDPTTSEAAITDVYQRIADDNLANVVSTSWGGAEDNLSSDTSFFDLEQQIFKQMAAQGQSMFAAAGDSGSWDQGSESASALYVNDPASQLYVTGAGGTSLTTNNSTGIYSSEKVWNNSIGASGGGISILWMLPTWQQNIFNPGVVSNGSMTMRNVPDVTLNADPETGYAACFQGSWAEIYGGTSVAAPLWAAFTALVNQARVADNCPVLGFASPPISYLATFNHPANTATGPNYTSDFHDITVGNNNVTYHYDFQTGT